MNDAQKEKLDGGIELEFNLDDSPQKVWRAISIPEFRERWLPKEALAEADAVIVAPGQEIRYRLRDDSPPFLGGQRQPDRARPRNPHKRELKKAILGIMALPEPTLVQSRRKLTMSRSADLGTHRSEGPDWGGLQAKLIRFCHRRNPHGVIAAVALQWRTKSGILASWI